MGEEARFFFVVPPLFRINSVFLPARRSFFLFWSAALNWEHDVDRLSAGHSRKRQREGVQMRAKKKRERKASRDGHRPFQAGDVDIRRR